MEPTTSYIIINERVNHYTIKIICYKFISCLTLPIKRLCFGHPLPWVGSFSSGCNPFKDPTILCHFQPEQKISDHKNYRKMISNWFTILVRIKILSNIYIIGLQIYILLSLMKLEWWSDNGDIPQTHIDQSTNGVEHSGLRRKNDPTFLSCIHFVKRERKYGVIFKSHKLNTTPSHNPILIIWCFS